VKWNQANKARIVGGRIGAMESNVLINCLMLALVAITVSILFKRIAK
jgi:hypothetical protein